MTMHQEFLHMMNTQTEIALATSVGGQPNVRIVNFYYQPESNTLYFSTFSDNPKRQEFEHNSQVAFTTIPKSDTEHIRVSHGKIQQSEKTIYDLASHFIEKIPSYAGTIEFGGSDLIIYEITFTEAKVTLNLMEQSFITFN